MEQIWRNCKGSVEVVLNSGTEAGPFYYTADLEITTKKGTLTTRSVGVFEGMPFGLGTQFDRVIGGTGPFFKFEAHKTGGTFVSGVSGKIWLD
jgi:hypothetical protein